jgi:hypothetical protein
MGDLRTTGLALLMFLTTQTEAPTITTFRLLLLFDRSTYTVWMDLLRGFHVSRGRGGRKLHELCP